MLAWEVAEAPEVPQGRFDAKVGPDGRKGILMPEGGARVEPRLIPFPGDLLQWPEDGTEFVLRISHQLLRRPSH